MSFHDLGTGCLVMNDVHAKLLRGLHTCPWPIRAIIFIRKTIGFRKGLFTEFAGSGFNSGYWYWFEVEKRMAFRRIATWTKK